MLVNIIQNTISSFRSALAAAEVITTNLKMWLGFETSETLGRDEVVDGDFPLPNVNWTTTGGFSVSGNAANCDGTNDSLVFQSISSLNDGDTIKVTFDVENYVSGTVRCGAGAGLQQPFGLALTGNVVGHTEIITKTSAIFAFGFRSYSFEGSVTNLKVQKLTQITPDKSGNNNVGELFTGKALEFDGNGDYVDIDGFQMTGTNATFAFWFNSNDTLGRFFDTVKDLSDNRLILSFNNNQISILDHSVSWFNFGSVTTNVWNRCVITIEGTTAKCFVNGVQLGVDKTISTIDLSLNTDAAIGSQVFGTQSFFDGEMSDFQIYNSAWTTDDIAYDYANPNKLAIDNPSTSLSVTNLKGYWALSEGDGLVAYDSSGGGNNGTINGATYEPAQPRIPQLGMQNWAKSTPVANEVTLIPNPTIPTQDILGNAVRDRLNSFNLDGTGYAKVDDSTSLGITNGTLQFWLKTTDTDFTILQGAVAKEYIGRTNNNAWSNGGTATISTFIDNAVSSSQPLYDNDWHFYTFTGININLWTEFSIGDETLDGLISDVLIYDGVLTSNQIKNNYNAGLSAHTN